MPSKDTLQPRKETTVLPLASGQALDTLHGHLNRVTSVDFSPNGQVLASGSYDKNIILWDVAQGAPLAPPLIGHTNDVNSVAWAPDGKSLKLIWHDEFDGIHPLKIVGIRHLALFEPVCVIHRFSLVRAWFM